MVKISKDVDFSCKLKTGLILITLLLFSTQVGSALNNIKIINRSFFVFFLTVEICSPLRASTINSNSGGGEVLQHMRSIIAGVNDSKRWVN